MSNIFGVGEGTKMITRTALSGTVLVALMLFSNASQAVAIDLNDFFFFPGDPVIVSADGSTATIGETSGVSPIILANDPGLGDPEVIIAGNNVGLQFDFTFTEGVGEDSAFSAFILDASTGTSVGPGFNFLANSSSSGTVLFDLTTLVGLTLGLEFDLFSFEAPALALTGSSVVISNVSLESLVAPEVIPIPPAPLLMGLSGLLLLLVHRTSVWVRTRSDKTIAV